MSDTHADDDDATALAQRLRTHPSLDGDDTAKVLVAELQRRLAEVQAEMQGLPGQQESGVVGTPPETFTVRGGLLYRADGRGPYCPLCHDRTTNLIRMSAVAVGFREPVRWRCPVCPSRGGGKG